MTRLLLPTLLFFVCFGALAGQTAASIDTVFSFAPGAGQSSGQDAKYFPANIFGLPDTIGRYEVPTVRPEQVCSIGMGGEIVVGFRHAVLRDGPGADFTIFENAFFTSLGGGRIYAEPARVAVSRDGITFVEFPFDSLSLAGCAGHTPTYGNADPYNPAVSGGDVFDLADIGMDSVRYIRITDITEIVKNNTKHPNWDPTLSGFDLDAVLGLYVESDGTNTGPKYPVVRFDAPLVEVWIPQDVSSGVLRLFSLDGRLVGTWQLDGGYNEFPLLRLMGGAYLADVLYNDNNQRTTRLLIYEP